MLLRIFQFVIVSIADCYSVPGKSTLKPCNGLSCRIWLSLPDIVAANLPGQKLRNRFLHRIHFSILHRREISTRFFRCAWVASPCGTICNSSADTWVLTSKQRRGLIWLVQATPGTEVGTDPLTLWVWRSNKRNALCCFAYRRLQCRPTQSKRSLRLLAGHLVWHLTWLGIYLALCNDYDRR